ncbi:MAG: HAD-superfamily hydrolase, subfamily variant 3 [Candidatus Saccharibacteria bacterium]|nr:HAD-superfamily hydrolase, subfamily variant 3 [Candidatus Saccharibacteria bacterium]
MIDFVVKGAIFDVDDTLLDNKPGVPGFGLHERSRLAAVHEVGKRRGIKELEDVSVDENWSAFRDAPVHTIEAAVWGIFLKKGLADSDVINLEHPLLKEIVVLKDELHKDVLLNEANEVPGATDFVFRLSTSGLKDKMAIASSAIRRDVDLFLDKTGMDAIFTKEKITTIENITHPKPHPEAFNIAFDSLNLPETDRFAVCAFEDDPRGIVSARAAGLYVCAITTRYKKEELLALEFPPHLVADSYTEFCELFQV